MPSWGGQSCRGYSQLCSHHKAEGHFSGQWEGALVPEMLLREATSLATSLAPATSWALLNPEGWEAGGGGEKPSQVAFYWVIYRLSQILEKKSFSKLTVLQSKTSRCAQEPCGSLQAPSRQGSGGGEASSFPQRARTGGHDICGCPKLFFSSSKSRLCCRRRKSADLVPQAQMGRSRSLQLMMNLPHPLGTG